MTTDCPCNLCLTPSGCDVCRVPVAQRNDRALGVTFADAFYRGERNRRIVIGLLWACGAAILLAYALWCRALLTELHTIANRPDITVAWNGAQVRDHRPRTLGVLPGLDTR